MGIRLLTKNMRSRRFERALNSLLRDQLREFIDMDVEPGCLMELLQPNKQAEKTKTEEAIKKAQNEMDKACAESKLSPDKMEEEVRIHKAIKIYEENRIKKEALGKHLKELQEGKSETKKQQWPKGFKGGMKMPKIR